MQTERSRSIGAASPFSQWLDDPAEITAPPALSEVELRQSLTQIAERAALRSARVSQALAEWQATQFDVKESKGQRLPQIDVGFQTRPTYLEAASSYPRNGQAVTVNMTTPIYDGGRIRKTIHSRTHSAQAAQQRYDQELAASAFEVSNNVAELNKNRLIHDIQRRYVVRMSMLASMLEEIVAVDRGRASELSQAKARLLQAQESRDAVAARVLDIELNLHKLIGEGLVPIPIGREWPLRAAALEKILPQVGSQPAIKQAAAETNAAQFQADAIKASSKPQVNWVVSKSTGKDELDRERPWETFLSVSWPLARGGSTRAAQEAALSRATASRENHAQLQLDYEYSVRKADQDARILLARALTYQELTVETDRVRKAFFEQWYHLGRRTLLDVLIAESDHNNNRVNEVTSRFESYQAVLRQYHDAGMLLDWLGQQPINAPCALQDQACDGGTLPNLPEPSA